MNCSPERKQAEGNLTSPGTTRRPNRREGTFGWIQTQSNNPLILPPNQGTLCLVTTITCHPPPQAGHTQKWEREQDCATQAG